VILYHQNYLLMKRRNAIRTMITGGVMTISAGSVRTILAGINNNDRSKWQIGHHFWNWPREWNSDLDTRLRLTKNTGYDGFESKPDEIGIDPLELKDKCSQYGVICAGIGGSVKSSVDYAFQAGIKMVRTQFPKEETKRWVEYAGERDIILTAHNHIGREGFRENAVEDGEDLLRYLDERPGMYACPDTGHLLLCGSDPVQTILELGERCRFVHLKDIKSSCVGIDQAKKGMWVELGKGALDVDGVTKALEKVKFDGWLMVEYHPEQRDYEQSAHRMRQVLKDIGY